MKFFISLVYNRNPVCGSMFLQKLREVSHLGYMNFVIYIIFKDEESSTASYVSDEEYHDSSSSHENEARVSSDGMGSDPNDWSEPFPVRLLFIWVELSGTGKFK